MESQKQIKKKIKNLLIKLETFQIEFNKIFIKKNKNKKIQTENIIHINLNQRPIKI